MILVDKLFFQSKVLAIGGVGVIAASTATDAVVVTSELTIAEWLSFGLWISLMIATGIIGLSAFTSAYIKDGFAGLDKILVDSEAGNYLTKILAFLFLEGFFGLLATEFNGRYPHSSELYYITASCAVGSGAASLVSLFKKRHNDKEDAK